MILDLGEIAVRSFRPDDLAALCRYAGDREVSIQLRDRFPFPYTPEDGEKWLRAAVAQDPETAFAIASPEELIGGIGLELGSDVHLRTAELGYWLGRPFWGHGFATRAVRALSAWAFETFELDRLGACVFENNPASARVLEKAGFTLEGRLRNAVVKEGRTMDMLLFGLLRGEAPPAPPALRFTRR